MKKRKHANERPPWEFSKRLAAWCVMIATAAAIASYVLAFRGLETAEGITTTIFTITTIIFTTISTIFTITTTILTTIITTITNTTITTI